MIQCSDSSGVCGGGVGVGVSNRVGCGVVLAVVAQWGFKGEGEI